MGHDDDRQFSAAEMALGALTGGAIGYGIAKWIAARDATSKAERDYPEKVAEIAEALDHFFDEAQIQYDPAWKEDDIANTVAYALTSALQGLWQVQVRRPVGIEGAIPDIIVGGLFVVECKKTPIVKTEIDRCFGQCECLTPHFPVVVLTLGREDDTGVRRLETRMERCNVRVIPFCVPA